MSARKRYLGDAVYVDYDGHLLTLTVDYGSGPEQMVHLEPKVYSALLRYVEWQKAATPPRALEHREEEP